MTIICGDKIKKPHWLSIVYCKKKNELVSKEKCYKCNNGGKC